MVTSGEVHRYGTATGAGADTEEGEHAVGQEPQLPTRGPATGRATVKQKGATMGTTMLLLLKLATLDDPSELVVATGVDE